jgi:hypothetical protein
MVYKVIRGAISKELAQVVSDYFLMKRQVVTRLFDDQVLAPDNYNWGHIKGDSMVPGSYAMYGDILTEVLLKQVKPVVELEVGQQLYESYSYVRLYEKGATLRRHKDRGNCEYSSTINVGGDLWPIFLEPSGLYGRDGVSVELEPGDMLIYEGRLQEHWRESFTGDYCAQVFLHYSTLARYDGRDFLGLPTRYRPEFND